MSEPTQQYDKDKPAVFEHPWYIVNELSRNYNVVKIPLDTAAIENVDALLVIHPAGIQERAVYALDQYLMRGGKMAVFLDPRSFYSMIKLKNDYSYMETHNALLDAADELEIMRLLGYSVDRYKPI